MIELTCEGQGTLAVRHKDIRGGNYESSIFSSFGQETLSRPIARDLLRIGQAAFLADRAFRRGTVLGRRTRRLSVVVPVEEPERWSAARKLITSVANFASQDDWQFDFTQTRRVRANAPAEMPAAANRSVNLFSNGLDSLCGAAAALQRKEHPVFVSHSPPGIQYVRSKITSLGNALGYADLQPEFVNLRFRVSDLDRAGARNMFPERSRRTRPFLFLSMAGAVAVDLGIPKIHLNENGVLAINLPFESHLQGSNASRHAHPETLRRFEKLLRAVWPFEQEPTVTNPFASLTKAEELRYLRNAQDLAETTISCEYAGQQMAMLRHWLRKTRGAYKRARECGLCMPCLIRRIAMQAAGLVEAEGHYVFDVRRVLSSPRSYRKAPLIGVVRRNVRTLQSFTNDILQMKASEFAVTYLSDLSYVPARARDINTSAHAAHRLYRRFARECAGFLSV